MEKIKFLPLCEEFKLPEYATEGAANFDLRVHLNSKLDGNLVGVSIYYSNGSEYHLAPASFILSPGDRALIPLGFAIELPKDKKLEIYSRSGLSIKDGIIVLNAPGQVDSDYRGCVCVIIKNEGSKEFIINEGDRICQGTIVNVNKCEFKLVNNLSETNRGIGGFGHSGTK